MSDWRARLRILRTGVCEWVDPETGQIEVDLLSWHDRWNLFGVHSSNWRWVRKFGERDCGCTFNPITRRKVLTKMDCPDHGVLPWMRDSFAEDWANDEEWKDEWT
jgi:hypothetical protein